MPLLQHLCSNRVLYIFFASFVAAFSIFMRVPVGLNLITNTLIVPSARSMAASARVPSNVAMDHLRSIIPPFNKPFHKGEHGMMGVGL